MSPALYVAGLSEEDHATLRRWANREGRSAQRARVVLLSYRGMTAYEISKTIGMARANVTTWIRRFNEQGLAGLCDRPRTGRPRKHA